MSEEDRTDASLDETAETSQGDTNVNFAAGHSQGTNRPASTRLFGILNSGVSDMSERIKNIAKHRPEILQVASVVVGAALLETFNSGPTEGAAAGLSLYMGTMADQFLTAAIASHRALGSPELISEDEAMTIFRPPGAADFIERLSSSNSYVTLFSILVEKNCPMPALVAMVADVCLTFCTTASIHAGKPTINPNVPHDASVSEILETGDLRDTSDSQ